MCLGPDRRIHRSFVGRRSSSFRSRARVSIDARRISGSRTSRCVMRLRRREPAEGKRPGGLSGDEREELARLRDENQTLRMEREILEKAAAFFARENDER